MTAIYLILATYFVLLWISVAYSRRCAKEHRSQYRILKSWYQDRLEQVHKRVDTLIGALEKGDLEVHARLDTLVDGHTSLADVVGNDRVRLGQRVDALDEWTEGVRARLDAMDEGDASVDAHLDRLAERIESLEAARPAVTGDERQCLANDLFTLGQLALGYLLMTWAATRQVPPVDLDARLSMLEAKLLTVIPGVLKATPRFATVAEQRPTADEAEAVTDPEAAS